MIILVIWNLVPVFTLEKSRLKKEKVNKMNFLLLN